MSRFSWQNVPQKPQTTLFPWSFWLVSTDLSPCCPRMEVAVSCCKAGASLGPVSDPASAEMFDIIDWEVGAISGGLGAQGQHYIQVLTCNVPHGTYGFMDTCRGQLRDVCLAGPLPISSPAHWCILWRLLSTLPLPATGGWQLHNANEWYGGQPKWKLFFFSPQYMHI